MISNDSEKLATLTSYIHMYLDFSCWFGMEKGETVPCWIMKHPCSFCLESVSHLLLTSLSLIPAFCQVSEKAQRVQFSHFISPFYIAQFGRVTSLIFKNGIFALATRLCILSHETYCGKAWIYAHKDWRSPQIPIKRDRSAIPTSVPNGVGSISQSVHIGITWEACLKIQTPRPEHRLIGLGFQEWNLYLI